MSLLLIGTMAVFGFRWYYPAKKSKYSMFYQIRDGYFAEWCTERKSKFMRKLFPIGLNFHVKLLPPALAKRVKVMFSLCLSTGGGGSAWQGPQGPICSGGGIPKVTRLSCVGGTPLAVTQEDTLVVLSVH